MEYVARPDKSSNCVIKHRVRDTVGCCIFRGPIHVTIFLVSFDISRFSAHANGGVPLLSGSRVKGLASGLPVQGYWQVLVSKKDRGLTSGITSFQAPERQDICIFTYPLHAKSIDDLFHLWLKNVFKLHYPSQHFLWTISQLVQNIFSFLFRTFHICTVM